MENDSFTKEQIRFIRSLNSTVFEFFKIVVLKNFELCVTSNENLFLDKIMENTEENFLDPIKLLGKYYSQELTLRILSSSKVKPGLNYSNTTILEKPLVAAFDDTNNTNQDNIGVKKPSRIELELESLQERFSKLTLDNLDLEKKLNQKKEKIKQLHERIAKRNEEINEIRKGYLKKIVHLEQKAESMNFALNSSKQGFDSMYNDFYSVYQCQVEANMFSFGNTKRRENKVKEMGKSLGKAKSFIQEKQSIREKMIKDARDFRERSELSSKTIKKNQLVLKEIQKFQKENLTVSRFQQTEKSTLCNESIRVQTNETRIKEYKNELIALEKEVDALNNSEDDALKERKSLQDEFYFSKRLSAKEIMIFSCSQVDSSTQTSPRESDKFVSIKGKNSQVSLLSENDLQIPTKKNEESTDKIKKKKVIDAKTIKEKEAEILKIKYEELQRKKNTINKENKVEVLKHKLVDLTIKDSIREKKMKELEIAVENQERTIHSLRRELKGFANNSKLIDQSPSTLSKLSSNRSSISLGVDEENEFNRKEIYELKQKLKKMKKLKNDSYKRYDLKCVEVKELEKKRKLDHEELEILRKAFGSEKGKRTEISKLRKELETKKTEILQLEEEVNSEHSKAISLDQEVSKVFQILHSRNKECEELKTMNTKFIDFICNKCRCPITDHILRTYLNDGFRIPKMEKEFVDEDVKEQDGEGYYDQRKRVAPKFIIKPSSSLKPKGIQFTHKKLNVRPQRPITTNSIIRKKNRLNNWNKKTEEKKNSYENQFFRNDANVRLGLYQYGKHHFNIRLKKKEKKPKRKSFSNLRHESHQEDDLIRISSQSKEEKQFPIPTNVAHQNNFLSSPIKTVEIKTSIIKL